MNLWKNGRGKKTDIWPSYLGFLNSKCDVTYQSQTKTGLEFYCTLIIPGLTKEQWNIFYSQHPRDPQSKRRHSHWPVQMQTNRDVSNQHSPQWLLGNKRENVLNHIDIALTEFAMRLPTWKGTLSFLFFSVQVALTFIIETLAEWWTT